MSVISRNCHIIKNNPEGLLHNYRPFTKFSVFCQNVTTKMSNGCSGFFAGPDLILFLSDIWLCRELPSPQEMSTLLPHNCAPWLPFNHF